ncbi:hypothetical protein MYP14_21955 [Rhodococcus pyridinivorans]|nr:hypothetical protein [Rhodococcus pyridinivorans]UPK63343.1 hypothetical protein MYP14_21955 [Rhodococcus pyridinivorans]
MQRHWFSTRPVRSPQNILLDDTTFEDTDPPLRVFAVGPPTVHGGEHASIVVDHLLFQVVVVPDDGIRGVDVEEGGGIARLGCGDDAVAQDDMGVAFGGPGRHDAPSGG